MRIRYGLTLDDLAAFSQYHHQHSPVLRQLRRRAVLLLSFATLLASAMIAHFLGTWEPVMFGGVAVLAMAILLPILQRRAVERNSAKLYREGQNKGVVGPHTMELHDDGLFDRTDYGERKTYWRGIERMERTDRYLFIYISALSAFILPRYSITEGDFDVFCEELQRRWNSGRL